MVVEGIDGGLKFSIVYEHRALVDSEGWSSEKVGDGFMLVCVSEGEGGVV